MENHNNEMKLNETAAGFLRESAKWSMFLAILGFVGVAFMLIAGIFMGTIMASLPMGNEMGDRMGSNPFSMMPGLIAVLYIIIAVLYSFPIYYLYKYADKTKIALQTANSDVLTEGLGYLKSHHKFLGIMMIVVISLYILMFLGMIVFFGAAAAM
jgi:hypothetical protein